MTKQEELAAFFEDLNFMLNHREHPENIAARLNTNCTALARKLARHGRHDLARHFGPHDKNQRNRDRTNRIRKQVAA